MYCRFGDPIHIDQLWVLIAMTGKPRTQTAKVEGLSTKDNQP